MEKIANIMSEKLGVKVDPKLVVKFPSDGCTDHMGSGPWEVYGARCGEFTVIVQEFADGSLINVSII